MGSGLLTSMAIADSFKIAALKRQSRDDDDYIARLQSEKQQLQEDCAANLLEKLALRQALGALWSNHPLLNPANAEIIHRKAARIISTPGATFDDVRSQEPAIRANDYKDLTSGGSLPSKGALVADRSFVERKVELEKFVASLPREYRNAAPKEHL